MKNPSNKELELFDLECRNEDETLSLFVSNMAPEILEKFNKTMQDMNEVLDVDANGTPIFRFENFLLSNEEFPTTASKIRQCNLELGSRKSALNEYRYLIKKKLIEKKKKDLELKKINNTLDKYYSDANCDDFFIELKELEILEIENDINHIDDFISDKILDIKRLTNESSFFIQKIKKMRETEKCTMEEYMNDEKFEMEFWARKR